jgi:hypothetical protein
MKIAPLGWSWTDFADVLVLVIAVCGLVFGIVVTR